MKIYQPTAFIFFLSLCFSSFTAIAAVTDEDFNKCVKVKEITIKITQDADKGVSREKALANNRPSFAETINLVYDFRGAMSNSEIAAGQMNNCLKLVSKN